MFKNRLIIAGLVMCLILAMVPSVLSAASSNSGVSVGSSVQQSTAPASVDKVSTTAVKNGVATAYWLELQAYPSTNTRALWLNVDNDWRYLSKPSSNIETSVQNAFANPDTFQVKVWYSGQKIVGLVVMTK
ncbi:hypothetical protein FXW07_18760 [Methanosarcina sp. DH1]|uniref:hypothetical protein n=1 Tax=Methanosarcina sp. DH1 TaxID=2605695 RepID=UPI001E471F34|nr:hypothetical protein [Methanosarcina sp. DH1]MCC4768582.1 hypothetical protein [Methanosarcina sp. DH1]